VLANGRSRKANSMVLEFSTTEQTTRVSELAYIAIKLTRIQALFLLSKYFL
jgi:hypothetical protein